MYFELINSFMNNKPCFNPLHFQDFKNSNDDVYHAPPFQDFSLICDDVECVEKLNNEEALEKMH